MIAVGWALPANAEVWHAFTVHTPDEPVRSRCEGAELPATDASGIEDVPQGRACLDCLLVMISGLPFPGQLGSMQ